MNNSMQMSEDEARREVETIAKIVQTVIGGLEGAAEAVKPSRWDRTDMAADMTDRGSRWDRMADAGDVTVSM